MNLTIRCILLVLYSSDPCMSDKDKDNKTNILIIQKRLTPQGKSIALVQSGESLSSGGLLGPDLHPWQICLLEQEE